MIEYNFNSSPFRSDIEIKFEELNMHKRNCLLKVIFHN